VNLSYATQNIGHSQQTSNGLKQPNGNKFLKLATELKIPQKKDKT